MAKKQTDAHTDLQIAESTDRNSHAKNYERKKGRKEERKKERKKKKKENKKKQTFGRSRKDLRHYNIVYDITHQ